MVEASAPKCTSPDPPGAANGYTYGMRTELAIDKTVALPPFEAVVGDFFVYWNPRLRHTQVSDGKISQFVVR